MTERTRATARLPGREVEIRHRKAPEEGTEYLSVSLEATPDLGAAPVPWLDPARAALAWAAFNPWLAARRVWGWPALGLAPRRQRDRQ